MNPYRDNKLDLHPGTISALCRGTHVVPIRVQLVVSDRCNHSCSFCAYRSQGDASRSLFAELDEVGEVISANPKRFIQVDKALEIIGDCQWLGVKAIEITGGGEPALHKHLSKIIQEIKDRNMDTGLVTNGVALRPQAIQALAAPGAESWVRVSLDAGKQSTYVAIRHCPPEHWNHAWKTIERCVANRDITNRSPLVVGVSFIVTEENWQEMELAARLARDAGVDTFRIGGVFTTNRAVLAHSNKAEALALAELAEQLSNDEFTVVNMLPQRMDALDDGKPRQRRCFCQEVSTYIGADLNVYRCCVNAYTEFGLLGSLDGRTFGELWNGLANDPAFGKFDARKCSRCPFIGKNESMAEAVNWHRHGAFV